MPSRRTIPLSAKQTLADLLRDWEQHEQAAALYQEVLDLLDDGNAASTDEDPDEDPDGKAIRIA